MTDSTDIIIAGTARGGPGPDETRSPSALESQELNSKFLLSVRFLRRFSHSVGLCSVILHYRLFTCIFFKINSFNQFYDTKSYCDCLCDDQPVIYAKLSPILNEEKEKKKKKKKKKTQQQKQNKTKQNKTKQNKTKQNKTKKNKATTAGMTCF